MSIMRIIPILIILLFAVPAMAVNPSNMTVKNGAVALYESDKVVTPIGGTLMLTLESNQTSNFSILINGTQVKYVTGYTQQFYQNVSATQGDFNLTINVNFTNGTGETAIAWLNSTKLNWSVANPPGISTANTTGQVGAADIINSSRNFNISINQTANVSWQIDSLEVQYNATSPFGKYVNYTNVSGMAGTHTVSAVVNNTNGTAYQNWTWTVTASTISGALVETNFSNVNTSRMNATGMNTSLSFYLNDSSNITYVNITTGDFTFGALVVADINTSQSFGVVTLATSGNTIIVKNSTGQRANHTGVWINLTTNVKPPAAGAGDYPINVATDSNPTGTNVTVYVRNTSRPFYVRANNTALTFASEDVSETYATNISFTGSGVANLTIFAPNITGQVNITQGYKATNVTYMKVVNATGNGSVIIYVTTDGTVTNPIIRISAAKSLQSRNFPAAIVGGAAVAVLVTVYALRRKKR